jgi:serine protease inhibitor
MKASIVLAGIGLLVMANVVPARDKPSPDVGRAVKDNNRFALELYGTLAEKDGNLFMSPYSISTALAMTYAGAKGQTAEQMAKTLHYTLPNDKLHAAFASLIKDQNDAKKRAYKLSVANALWGQKGYGFHADYLQLVKTNYSAGLQELDFTDAPEPARKTINDWVDNETQGKIKDLIPDGAIKPDTRLVLTNAIYFKASWSERFAEDATKKQDFWTNADQKAPAMMMQRKGYYSLVNADTFQLLDMPYEHHDLSMIVILPKRKVGVKEIEKTITSANLDDWLRLRKLHSVDVKLPKFKFTVQFNLKTTLTKMGMPIAFSNGADFSGMASAEKLKIDEVIHKAFVDVNEKGTEAAAATAVIIKTTSLPPELPKANFHADHPFVFLIRDNRSGSILFAGRVVKPG